MSAVPSLVGHYLQHIAAPATTAAYNHLAERAAMPPMRLGSTVQACGLVMEQIDLAAISLSLGHARGIAVHGRPKGDSAGPRAKGGVSRPTESAADELARIKDIGMDLAEALDRIHPDPSWPTIASGLRSRLRTATEVLAEACGDAWGTLSPAQALDDLADAVEGLHVNVTDAAAKARRAAQCRAWGRASEVDPPDPVLEAMRCEAWWLGADKDGEPIRCGQWRSEHRTETGSVHPSRICDQHFRELCPQCGLRPRRTTGASECMACEIRKRRQRAA